MAMTGEDDLTGFLPEPPPPAPKRREATIAEALARFDSTASPAAAPTPRKPSWWASLGRPQAGLLATAALVAAISLPFAWTTLDHGLPAADEQMQRGAPAETRMVLRDTVETPAPVAVAAPPPAKLSKGVTPAPQTIQPVLSAPIAKRVELAQADTAAPAAPATKVEDRQAITVTAQRAPRPVQASPSAVSAISAEAVEDSVVVTGTRIAARGAPRRGDWNACTVNDPGRTLSQCKKLANKGAKAVRAQADTHLSDGLKQAWEGNLGGAITAFDQAIAVAPDLSVAYLNRGLAYDRQGESARAIADLDRAVQYAPRSARAYYNRSILLRKQGDTKRAEADERRAISLDPRYQAMRRSGEPD
jgi:hypothetical protein